MKKGQKINRPCYKQDFEWITTELDHLYEMILFDSSDKILKSFLLEILIHKFPWLKEVKK
jgi:hypothetical protein